MATIGSNATKHSASVWSENECAVARTISARLKLTKLSTRRRVHVHPTAAVLSLCATISFGSLQTNPGWLWAPDARPAYYRAYKLEPLAASAGKSEGWPAAISLCACVHCLPAVKCMLCSRHEWVNARRARKGGRSCSWCQGVWHATRPLHLASHRESTWSSESNKKIAGRISFNSFVLLDVHALFEYFLFVQRCKSLLFFVRCFIFQ